MIYKKTGYKVCDAMTEHPVVVSPKTRLKECSKIMNEKHVGALIVKENDALLGLITEQDIVRKVIAKGINPLKEKVGGYMEKNVVTISPKDDIFEALTKMRNLNIRHLPVIDGKKMVGLLTLKDALKIQPQLFSLLLDKFELREESRKPIYHPRENEGICQFCGEYTEHLYEREGSFICEKCNDED